MSVRLKGPWPFDRVEQFLSEATIPIRLAVSGPSGVPLVVSLWFIWDEGALWCATQSGSRLAAAVHKRQELGFEVAADTPPYRGVRGQGRADILPVDGVRVLERLLVRYRIGQGSRLAGYLRENAATEVAIRISPAWIRSWDFSTRMSDAVGTPSQRLPRN